MKMGCSQKQAISVQHRRWNQEAKAFRTQHIGFPEWFLQGIRKYESNGAEFELLPGMVKIVWPGQPAILRTVADFEREYQENYLSKN